MTNFIFDPFKFDTEVQERFTGYPIEYIMSFLEDMGYEIETRDFLDFILVDAKYENRIGFKISFNDLSDQEVWKWQIRHVLILADPKEVLKAFDRYIALRIFT